MGCGAAVGCAVAVGCDVAAGKEVEVGTDSLSPPQAETRNTVRTRAPVIKRPTFATCPPYIAIGPEGPHANSLTALVNGTGLENPVRVREGLTSPLHL